MPFNVQQYGRAFRAVEQKRRHDARAKGIPVEQMPPNKVEVELFESLEKGEVKPFDSQDFISIRELFEETVVDCHGEAIGDAIAKEWRHRRNRAGYQNAATLFEAADAVSTASFANIIGQISYTNVLERYEDPAFLYPKLEKVERSNTQMPEMVPGVTRIGNVAQAVGQLQEYPRIGIGEEWISIGKKVKDGFTLAVSEETIFEDKTNLVAETLSSAGDAMGSTREIECLSNVLGITDTYSRNGGPVQATYADTHTQGTFDNLVASNALANASSIDKAKQALQAITDPNTGLPIAIIGNQIIVPPSLEELAWSIVKAVTVETVENAASGTTKRFVTGNPLQRMPRLEVLSSQYVRTVGGSDTSWWYGDFRRGFCYYEVWPLQTYVQDRNSVHAFERDIAMMVKVRRMGKSHAKDPRYGNKNTA